MAKCQDDALHKGQQFVWWWWLPDECIAWACLYNCQEERKCGAGWIQLQ